MIRLRRRERAQELLDDAAIDVADLEASLDDVSAVNRWLGGIRAVRLGIASLVGRMPDAALLDVGCGSGDVALALLDDAVRRGVRRRITAVDVHAGAVSIAARRTAHCRDVRVLRADVLQLPFADAAFDVAMASLTLHHLEPEQLVPALRELGRVARRGVVINELHRTVVNYAGARFLAGTVWRRRAITRHDGPLSVLRAFTPRELLDLAGAAGLRRPRVRRRFFYRIVLTGEIPSRAAAASTV